MGRETWSIGQQTEAQLLKEIFGMHQERQFNKNKPLLGRCKKTSNFGGDFFTFTVEQSIGGGVSSGALGRSSRNLYGKAKLTRKKLYATVTIERELMKVGTGGKESFVNVRANAIKKCTESFSRNIERQISLNDLAGTGLLATSTAVSTGEGSLEDPHVLKLPDDTIMFQFEEGDVVHLNNESTKLEGHEVVVVVDEPGKKEIHILSNAPAAIPAQAKIYMQMSKGKELPGLQGVLKATSGSYKDIKVGRRWKATQVDAKGAAISTAIINDVIARIEKTCGESPTFLLAPYVQYVALLDLHEDQKRYNLPAKGSKGVKASISYSGIEVMTGSGAIPVLRSRFVPDDEIYVINDSKMEIKCAPSGFQWFSEDGTVFLRDADEDRYGARYGGYADFYINPHFQGIITDLSVG